MQKQTLKSRVLTVLAAAAVAATVLGTATSASAAIAGQYDYTNPSTTGCAADGRSIASYPIKATATGATVGTLEVRYSPTCDTNWVRANNTLPGVTVHKLIERYRTHLPAGGALPYATQTESDRATGWTYGMQVDGARIACIGVGAWFTNDAGVIVATAGPKITIC